ncbi:t-SNARE VTI1 [Paramarasmius palmivorus]|uniref:t-SNARE VTI1 n=1 Tax=Paramarasmius palmivorus TaxID=297713 RepID=A0AAW0CL78_9AGAR
MDPTPTTLFDAYYQDYEHIIESVRNKLEKQVQEQHGEQRKATLRKVEIELDEADDIISQIEIEVQGIPVSIRPQYAARLKQAKIDLNRLKRLAKDTHAKASRGDLLGGRFGASRSDDPYRDEEQNERTRLLAGNQTLGDGQRRLGDATRIALETEALGADILRDLGTQRETIQHSRDMLNTADTSLDRASGTIKKMIRDPSNEFDDVIDLEDSDNLSRGLHDLLRSGQAPSTNELLYIHRILPSIDESVANLTTEIRRLQEILSAVLKKREAILSLGGSIRRLPPEVLSTILVFAAAMNGGELLQDKKWKSAGLKLGAVCSHWRNVVLGTPKVWDIVSLGVDQQPESSELKEWVYHRLESYLSRSRGTSVSLKLFDRFGYYSVWITDRNEQLGSLMKALLPRVRRLQLTHIVPDVFLRCYAGFLDNVQVLQIPGYSTSVAPIGGDGHRLLNVIGQAVPNLRHLIFQDSVYFTRPVEETTFAFHNITSLMFRSYYRRELDTLLAVVQRCENLNQFHLTTQMSGGSWFAMNNGGTFGEICVLNQPKPARFEFSKLSQLEFCIEYGRDFIEDSIDCCIRFFDGFTAPSLTSLSIDVKATTYLSGGAPDNLCVAIEEFIQRSNGSGLHHLHLDALLHDHHLASILSRTPELRKLVLLGVSNATHGPYLSGQQDRAPWLPSSNVYSSSWTITLGLLQRLTLSNGHSGRVQPSGCSPLVPKLRDLRFSIDRAWSPEHMSAFKDMLESRMPILRSAVLNVADFVNVGLLKELCRLQSAGLAVRVKETLNVGAGYNSIQSQFVLDYGRERGPKLEDDKTTSLAQLEGCVPLSFEDIAQDYITTESSTFDWDSV